MKIFLIGYMGCGKSTLGRQLAKKLMLTFLDLDSYIEQQQGRTIGEIFASDGEAKFREIESAALATVATTDNIVVATGGGAPIFNNNIELMNRSGITLYIKVDGGILTSRLLNAKTQRPIIKDKSEEELRDFVEGMIAQRSPFYQKAMITVEGKNIKVDQLVQAIQEW